LYTSQHYVSLDSQAAAVSRRTEYFFASRKTAEKKLRLSRKTADIYLDLFFPASRRKNFSLNLYYDEIMYHQSVCSMV